MPSKAKAETPVPFYICPSQESLWREFHDLLYTPTKINMIVSLPLTAQEFTPDLQDKLKAVFAALFHVELYRVSINSFTDTSNRRRLLANSNVVNVSIRIPKDSPGMSPEHTKM